MELNELLAQSDALKAEIDKLRPLKPEVEHRIMQKFRLDWNYHSNAIEGNSLTLGETRAFLMEGLTADGKPLKDHLDIKGHNELLTFLELFIQRKEVLTEAAVREMHRILLHEPYETEAMTLDGKVVKKRVRLGEYKQTENFVRTATGEIHRYTAPEDVPAKMDELIRWHRERQEKSDVHPLVHAALLHHRFLAIHPFDDGNGRLGRILMNLVLMRHGFPPVVVKLLERDQYVAALRRADAGESDGIVLFINQKLVDAETLYLRGAKGESIEDADDVDKALRLLKQELSKVEEPQELTQARFAQLFKETLTPLLTRTSEKLQQFDELYSVETVALSANRYIDPTLRNSVHGNSFSGSKKQLNEFLKKWDGQILSNMTVNFNWEGFRKAGLNDFSSSAQVQFSFEKRKYTVKSPSSGFTRQKMYQETLTEDERTEFVSGLAKYCLGQIDHHLKQVRKAK